MDKLGRVVPSDISDPWCARCGIALALGELSPTLSEEEVNFVMVKHKVKWPLQVNCIIIQTKYDPR